MSRKSDRRDSPATRSAGVGDDRLARDAARTGDPTARAAHSPAAGARAASEDAPLLLLGDEPRRVRLAVLVVALAVLLLYLPTIWSATWVDIDDGQYVLQNEVVLNPSLGGAWRFLREVRQPSTVVGYYQPFTMMSLMLDSWLTGMLGDGTPAGDSMDARVFHLTSVLLHVLNAVLVFFIARRLCGGVAAAAVAALIFGMHPLQVESVTWISQRKTVLASAGALSATLAYLRYGDTQRAKWLLAAFAGYLFAVMSKPTAMFLPVYLLLLDVWPLRRATWRAAVVEKLPFWLLMAAAAVVAYVSQQQTAGIGAPNPERAIGLLKVCLYNLVLYARNIVWPDRLSLIYALPSELSWSSPAILGSTAFALAAAAVWLTSWRWLRPLFVSLGGAAVLLGVAIGPVQFMQSSVGDRFMYLPLAALTPLAALLLQRAWQRGADGAIRVAPAAAAAVATAAVLIALTQRTLAYQVVWSSPEPLWTNVLKYVPDQSLAHAGLVGIRIAEARALIERGERAEAAPILDKALDHIDRAIRVAPNDAGYHENRGEVLMLMQRGPEAVEAVRRALELGLGPMQSAGEVSLARALVVAARADEAARHFDQLLASAAPPKFALRMQMGYAFLEGGRADLARHCFRTALDAAADEPQAWQMLAVAAAIGGDWNEALEAFRRADAGYRERGRTVPEVDLGMAKTLLELGRLDEAEALFSDEEVVRTFPAESDLGLAAAAALRGQRELALQRLSAALQADPKLRGVAANKAHFASLHDDERWRTLVGPPQGLDAQQGP